MEGLLIAGNMARTADLAHHFLEAVDQAAIASASWRGLGDKNAADAAAVEAMAAILVRNTLSSIFKDLFICFNHF